MELENIEIYEISLIIKNLWNITYDENMRYYGYFTDHKNITNKWKN